MAISHFLPVVRPQRELYEEAARHAHEAPDGRHPLVARQLLRPAPPLPPLGVQSLGYIAQHVSLSSVGG